MDRTMFKYGLLVLVTGIVGLLPFLFPEALPLSPIQHTVLVLFTVVALCWLLEPIPVYATSILIISALCFMVSDSALTPVRMFFEQADKTTELVSYKSVFNCFASPVIILFFGGFALAIGASKYKLDANLAAFLLNPFGSNPKFIMLGLMIITSCFSMFMSNTATTVMMLAMVMPILAFFENKDRGIKGVILSIPFAANIGGIATPIGTPPNAIALGYISKDHPISFFELMSWGLPTAVVCVILSWFLLLKLFPFEQKSVTLNIKSNFSKEWRAIVVYVTFAVTILLWMTEKLHGINSYVVSLVPILVFTSARVIKAKDIKTMNWDVVWLVAGGIALGEALSVTGTAKVLANVIDYSSLSPLVLVVVLGLIGWIASNFISNTATANLVMPIAMAVFVNIDFAAVGIDVDLSLIVMVLAFTMSFGMSLPISTPPNALAYASGKITNKDMVMAGGIMSLSCFIITIVLFKMIGM